MLLQDQDDQSYMKSRSNIDLSKVKGYLHSMGNSVPENALELLNSVEQYQKVSTCLFVTPQVNSYGHGGKVSSPNHTFSWASLNKWLTSTS